MLSNLSKIEMLGKQSRNLTSRDRNTRQSRNSRTRSYTHFHKARCTVHLPFTCVDKEEESTLSMRLTPGKANATFVARAPGHVLRVRFFTLRGIRHTETVLY